MFPILIITRNLIPRNRGAACTLIPRLGMPSKIAQITRNSKGLNQIGWVCASSAKRDFGLRSSNNAAQQDSNGNLAVKLLRTYTMQLEALQRYRGKASYSGVCRVPVAIGTGSRSGSALRSGVSP